MDGRAYAERLRGMTLFGYALRNPGRGRGLNGSEIAFKAGGAQPIVNRGVLVNNDPLLADQTVIAEEAAAEAAAQPIAAQAQLLAAVDQLIQYHASISQAPTKGARIQYLFLLGAASAYSWVSSQATISGTKDSWNWDTRYPLTDDSSQAIFLTNALVYVLGKIIPSYNSSTLLGRLSALQQAAQGGVLSQAHFSDWSAAYESWWTARASDGSVAAAAFPAPSDLPNGSTYLDVSTTQDFTNATAYPNLTQWTPLIVEGAQKKYLTMTWNSVTSSCLSGAQETSIKSTAAAEVVTGAARNSEIDALLTLCQALTDEQKILAEFWAGGPGTPAPPGIALWLWRHTVAVNGASLYQTVYSGLELASGLFEASRLAWGLKAQFKESRPIQAIRRNYVGQTLTKYDGTSIAAALWVPYQMPNFVTPPFPDFVSGHSTFSQVLANIMTAWFGSALPSTQFTLTDAETVAPVLQNGTIVTLGYWPVAAGASEIQPGVVPAAPLTLTFSSWQDLADSAGISRLYGGIHAQSANLGGKSLANALTPAVTNAWGITKA
jgi:hypothetical protein